MINVSALKLLTYNLNYSALTQYEYGFDFILCSFILCCILSTYSELIAVKTQNLFSVNWDHSLMVMKKKK